MADRTEASIVIDAAPSEIMRVITDFEAYPEWAEIKAAEIKERDGDERPTKVYFEVAAGPVNARYTLEYRYFAGDGGLEWSFIEGSGLKNLEGEYVLQPSGSSTNVTYRLAVDISIPGPGFLKRKLLAEGEKRIIDTALKGLKARVEAAS